MSKPIFSSLDNLSLQDMHAEGELIPLMTTEDEEALELEELPEAVPILPLKNTVLFPGVVIPITVGRDKSIQLIKDANKGDKVIGVVAQKDQSVEDPSVLDIYPLGTVAQILRVLTMPDGNTTIIIQGKKRFEIEQVLTEDPYIKAKIKGVAEDKNVQDSSEFGAIVDSIKDLHLKSYKRVKIFLQRLLLPLKISKVTFLIHFVSSNMSLTVKEKQGICNTKFERTCACVFATHER